MWKLVFVLQLSISFLKHTSLHTQMMYVEYVCASLRWPALQSLWIWTACRCLQSSCHVTIRMASSLSLTRAASTSLVISLRLANRSVVWKMEQCYHPFCQVLKASYVNYNQMFPITLTSDLKIIQCLFHDRVLSLRLCCNAPVTPCSQMNSSWSAWRINSLTLQNFALPAMHMSNCGDGGNKQTRLKNILVC